MDDSYDHDYGWLDRENDGVAYATNRLAERRVIEASGWSATRNGWSSAPSRDLLIRWFTLYPAWQGYDLEAVQRGGAGPWAVRDFRRSEVWMATFGSLEEALAAIDDKSLLEKLRFEEDDRDASIRTWQGGSPGQGRGGSRGRRR